MRNWELTATVVIIPPVFDHAPPLEPYPSVRQILPVERVSALLEVVLCSGIPTQLLVIWVLLGFGVPTQTEDGRLFPLGVFLLSLIDTALVIGLVVMLLRAHRESVRDVLIGNRPILREMGLGLLLIPVVFFLVALVLVIVLQYAPYLRNVPRNPLESMLETRADAIVFAFVVMIAGGLREEIQRGFIIHRFDGYLGGGAIGVIAYSLMFGLFHYPQGWDASIATGCLGAAWGFVYLRRRSIIAPVVSHAGFNLLQVLKTLAIR